MFCEKCGQKLDDDAKFCDKCGAPVEAAPAPQAPVAPAPQACCQAPAQAPYQAPQKPAGETGKKIMEFIKKNAVALGIGAAVIAIVIGVVVYLKTRPLTVELNDFVSVEFSGYDTVGQAQVNFDREEFVETYGGKFRYKGKGMSELENAMKHMGQDSEEYQEYVNNTLCRTLLEKCVDGDLDKDSDLSNGATVTYKWDCDAEDALEDFGVKLKFEDIPFTVEGLKEAQKVDPLKDAKVVFEGTAPYITAKLDRDSLPDYRGYLEIEMSQRDSLSNGDTVTLKVTNLDSASMKNYFLENYGIILTGGEKSFKVENMPAYATEYKQIGEEGIKMLGKQAKDFITAQAAKDWSDSVTLKKMTYQGCHFLTVKDITSRSRTPNTAYLVYKVDVEVKVPDDEVDEKFSYYAAVKFPNLLVQDGKIQIEDLDDCGLYRHSFSKQFPHYNWFYFHGYPTLEALYKDRVTSAVDRYNCESTVKAK